jgi:glycosyltransferase involved in cell wall biosynthesis
MLNAPLDIIYLLAANYARGGIKIQIEQANRLARLGHRVRVLSNVDPPDWIALHIPWQRVTVKDGQVLGSELPPADVVVFSFYEQAFGVLRSCVDSGAVPVYFAQGDEILFGEPEEAANEAQRGYIAAARASVHLPSPILTVSESAAVRIRAFGGNRISVIPNGIDRTVFHPQDRSSSGPLRLLAVGGELPAFKGMKELYAAVIKLKRDPNTPAFAFVRAAPGENRFSSLPVEVEYHRHPTQPELARLYAGADLFVAASHNESFYLTPLEAMSCGTPVVCSNLPPVREYARPEEDFLPFPPGDVAALCRRIDEALRDEDLRLRLGAAGVNVAERLDWDIVIGRIDAYLRDLASQAADIHAAIRSELRNPRVPFSFHTQ